MSKLRKTGAVDENGNLVTIPRLPSVTGANKPPGWRYFSAAQKIASIAAARSYRWDLSLSSTLSACRFRCR